MIINILGIDGIGKSTHIYRLADEIKEAFGVDTRVVSKSDIMDRDAFPEAKFIGVSYHELATECLPYMKGCSRVMWLLYIFSVILGKYPPKENEIILMDGYWHKHYGTEMALGIDGEWIKMVCSIFPKPDFVVMLDINPEKILLREGKKVKPYECGLDIECNPESFVRHQSKVRKIFKELITEYNSEILCGDADMETVYQSLKNSIFRQLLKDIRKTEIY